MPRRLWLVVACGQIACHISQRNGVYSVMMLSREQRCCSIHVTGRHKRTLRIFSTYLSSLVRSMTFDTIAGSHVLVSIAHSWFVFGIEYARVEAISGSISEFAFWAYERFMIWTLYLATADKVRFVWTRFGKVGLWITHSLDNWPDYLVFWVLD